MRHAGAALALLMVPALAHAADDAAFVVLGENGQAVARVITAEPACPVLTVNGKPQPMAVRAAAETLAQRPTQSTPENSKPTAFPVTVCEAPVPAGAVIRTGAARLPSVARTIRRIVVIGDTGCRLKASDNAYQSCNDPAAYPFARVAARAAEWRPQLVVHVGDYHYRENPCLPAKADCAGSPWGYGWDAWNADLFAPGKALFAAAPWVVVRGNHENCARAGQGWWRLLDPRPMAPGRDCNRAADDATGDAASAYAVPLGDGAAIVVADLATAGDKPIDASDPRYAQFATVQDTIAHLTAKTRFAFVATHKPILGITATKQGDAFALRPTTIGIQSVFAARDPGVLATGVDAVLAGHVHLWEQVDYAGRLPSQFIAGFSGTLEDVVPLPAKLPPDFAPVAGIAAAHFSSWVDGFGYMTLERTGARRWTVRVWGIDGREVNRCRIDGRASSCRKPQVH